MRRDLRNRRILLTGASRGIGRALAMQLADIDLQQGRAVVRRGKGGRGRAVPFGPQTDAAVDRYIRARRSHCLSSTGELVLAAVVKRSCTTA